jgi:hypothetical protein
MVGHFKQSRQTDRWTGPFYFMTCSEAAVNNTRESKVSPSFCNVENYIFTGPILFVLVVVFLGSLRWSDPEENFCQYCRSFEPDYIHVQCTVYMYMCRCNISLDTNLYIECIELQGLHDGSPVQCNIFKFSFVSNQNAIENEIHVLF